MAKKKPAKPKRKCLTCDREVHARGLCPACSRAALAILKSIADPKERSAAEQKMIGLKLILPAQRPGPAKNAWNRKYDRLAVKSRKAVKQ